MTGESPLAEQQRAVVELYVHSKWIKANLALEDENLFLEYAINDQQLSNEIFQPDSTIYDQSDKISSEKRLVKIVKPDNTGLGRISLEENVIVYLFFEF